MRAIFLSIALFVLLRGAAGNPVRNRVAAKRFNVPTSGSVSGSGSGSVSACVFYPLFDLPTLAISPTHTCSDANTFYFSGIAPDGGGTGSCQGPSTWTSPSLAVDNTTDSSTTTTTQVWVRPSIQIGPFSQGDPYCTIYAIFDLYRDSGCSTPFNVVTGPIPGNNFYSKEQQGICINAEHESVNYLPEIGSITISPASHIKPTLFILLFSILITLIQNKI